MTIIKLLTVYHQKTGFVNSVGRFLKNKYLYNLWKHLFVVCIRQVICWETFPTNLKEFMQKKVIRELELWLTAKAGGYCFFFMERKREQENSSTKNWRSVGDLWQRNTNGEITPKYLESKSILFRVLRRMCWSHQTRYQGGQKIWLTVT